MNSASIKRLANQKQSNENRKIGEILHFHLYNKIVEVAFNSFNYYLKKRSLCPVVLKCYTQTKVMFYVLGNCILFNWYKFTIHRQNSKYAPLYSHNLFPFTNTIIPSPPSIHAHWPLTIQPRGNEPIAFIDFSDFSPFLKSEIEYFPGLFYRDNI